MADPSVPMPQDAEFYGEMVGLEGLEPGNVGWGGLLGSLNRVDLRWLTLGVSHVLSSRLVASAMNSGTLTTIHQFRRS